MGTPQSEKIRSNSSGGPPRFIGFEFAVAKDFDALSRRAAQIIIRALKERPSLLLCASAGGTPTGAYQLLATRRTRHPELFRQMRVLQIDEWGGLPAGCAASCEADLKEKLLKPLGIDAGRYSVFKTDASDPQAECLRMQRWLGAHGPIDICILGLGINGHVAMNEPAADLVPQAHVAKLSKSSLAHAMLKGLKQKPRYGLTIGMGDILRSQRILLLVSGAKKREAMKRLLRPRVSTRFPASFLWLRGNTTVLCDRQAMGTEESYV